MLIECLTQRWMGDISSRRLGALPGIKRQKKNLLVLVLSLEFPSAQNITNKVKWINLFDWVVKSSKQLNIFSDKLLTGKLSLQSHWRVRRSPFSFVHRSLLCANGDIWSTSAHFSCLIYAVLKAMSFTSFSYYLITKAARWYIFCLCVWF